MSTYFVYIAEAHAFDQWQMDSNEDAEIRIVQHTALEDRLVDARSGARRLGLILPVLVDGMDNAASEAFAAWPERIYVIGEDGRIAFRGDHGPWGFDAEAATRALDEIVTAVSARRSGRRGRSRPMRRSSW